MCISNKKQEVIEEQQEGREGEGRELGVWKLEGLTACRIFQ